MSPKQSFFHCLSRFRYSKSQTLRTPTNPSPVPEEGEGDKNSNRYLSSVLWHQEQCWVLLPEHLPGKVTQGQTHEGSSLEPRGMVHRQPAWRAGQGLRVRLLLPQPQGQPQDRPKDGDHLTGEGGSSPSPVASVGSCLETTGLHWGAHEPFT